MIEDYESINKMTDAQAAEVLENVRIRIYGGRGNGKTRLFYSYNVAMQKAIQKLKTGWIPVSERLPEEKGYFLTSTVFDDVYCDFWNGEEFERTEMILAWMPLPEPYKKEGEEE